MGGFTLFFGMDSRLLLVDDEREGLTTVPPGGGEYMK